MPLHGFRLRARSKYPILSPPCFNACSCDDLLSHCGCRWCPGKTTLVIFSSCLSMPQVQEKTLAINTSSSNACCACTTAAFCSVAQHYNPRWFAVVKTLASGSRKQPALLTLFILLNLNLLSQLRFSFSQQITGVEASGALEEAEELFLLKGEEAAAQAQAVPATTLDVPVPSSAEVEIQVDVVGPAAAPDFFPSSYTSDEKDHDHEIVLQLGKNKEKHDIQVQDSDMITNIDEIIRRMFKVIDRIPYHDDNGKNGIHPVSLITLDENAFPSSRLVVPRGISNDFTSIKLNTRTNTRKVQEITNNSNKVSVTWEDQKGKGGWIVAKGVAVIVPLDQARCDILVDVVKVEVMDYNEKLMADTEGWKPLVLERNAGQMKNTTAAGAGAATVLSVIRDAVCMRKT
ncbi:unnamed protein product [Amoebophrya sp. A120]|nr:unnamed protein product [Amoebophrya sp. A120]|eukprot:GSA120T00009008001.1